AAPPAIGSGVVELVRTRRQEVAYGLLAFAAAFLLLAVWMGFKAMKPGAASADAPAAEINPLDAKEPAKPLEIANPKRGDYLVGGLAVLNGFLVLATVGAFLLVSIPPPEPEKQRANVRLVMLLAGTEIGAVLILAGAAFFYRWSDSVLAYLDKDATAAKQVWKVMVPLLMIALGAGVMFLSILPARADERNSPAIRRTVYGANLGLTALLLLTALVIGNVIVAMRVPNKLDVTEAALTSISPPTKRLIEQLTETVTVYQIAEEGRRVSSDTRNLLDRMAEANPTKLKVVSLSLTADKRKLDELAAKYPPVATQGGLGVLLTTGPDEKRHAFVREDDLTTEEMGEGGPRGARKLIFQGEEKIARELAFLAEGGKKSVVYVTQGGGELSLGGGGEPAPENRSMATLRAYLERSNLDVKPLTFDPVNPVVPPDAGVVMIADPRSPFPPPIVAALEKYMNESRGEAGKGKLLVFSGARAGADGKIPKTGLEPLLEKFGVILHDRLLMAQEMNERYGWFDQLAVPTNVRNPIAELFETGVGPWAFCRPLGLTQMPPGGPLQVQPVFMSMPQRASWLEETVPTNIRPLLSELNSSPEIRQRKQLTDRPRPLAVAVTETPQPSAPGQPPGSPTPRLVVFGAGDFVSDATARRGGGASLVSPNVALIGATADWLRERPAIGVGGGNKTYATYKLSPTADDTRLVLLPLGLALLIVVGLGAGVWVIRRS
ncbi:MAG TPA: Gldg family protein, partial [Gemmataceae bacterium]|nr:Gldg family protein [Gemmataceae bacterium]